MILIFAGAGASFAVNNTKYPTTREFFNSLARDITGNKVFMQCLSYLSVRSKNNQPDIEDVLFYLYELKSNFKNLSDTNSILLDHLIQSDQNLENQIRKNYVEQYKPILDGLIRKINLEVFPTYIHEPDLNDLQKNWIPVLEYLLTQDNQIEIFTTNYDVVLEKVILEFKTKTQTYPQDTNGVHKRIDLREWQGHFITQGHVRLTKLHGSVNWTSFTDDRYIYTGYPSDIGNPDNRPIIYPGFKGSPDKEPFITFHQHFSESIQKSNVIIFIGFAFRDQYINEILSTNLTDQRGIVIIDPNEELIPPFSHNGKLKHIIDGFGVSSIDKLNEELKQMPKFS